MTSPPSLPDWKTAGCNAWFTCVPGSRSPCTLVGMRRGALILTAVAIVLASWGLRQQMKQSDAPAEEAGVGSDPATPSLKPSSPVEVPILHEPAPVASGDDPRSELATSQQQIRVRV